MVEPNCDERQRSEEIGLVASKRQTRQKLRVFSPIILLTLASASLHFLYVWEVSNSPLIAQERASEETDMHFFHSWAKQIAAGDYWSENVALPQHVWHRDIAAAFLRKNSTVWKKIDPGKNKSLSEITSILWNEWCPPKKFYQEPLYPYFIAASYRVFGEGNSPVFFFQAMLGTTSTVLVYLITRSAFGRGAAIFAGVLSLGCPMLLFFDATLLRESAIVFFTLVIIYATMHAKYSWDALGVGILLGVSVMLKSHYCLMTIPILFVLFFRYQSRRYKWIFACLFVIGVLIGASPMLIRNAKVGVPVFGSPTGGYFTFIGANVPDYPHEGGFFQSEEYSPGLINGSKGSMVSAIKLTLASHPGLDSFFRLYSSKVGLVVNWFEVPNVTNYYFVCDYSVVLKHLPFGFAWIAPLGFVGFFSGFKKIDNAWSLYAMLGLNFIVIVVFFVMDRYKAPLVATLIPFAGLASFNIWSTLWRPSNDEVADGGRKKISKGRVLFGYFLVIGFFAAIVCRPHSASMQMYRAVDPYWVYNTYYKSKIETASQNGDFELALDQMEEFLSVKPRPIVEILESGKTSVKNLDWRTVELYAKYYARCAVVCEASGKKEAERTNLAKSKKLNKYYLEMEF